jgi:hypothetical protein
MVTVEDAFVEAAVLGAVSEAEGVAADPGRGDDRDRRVAGDAGNLRARCHVLKTESHLARLSFTLTPG